MQAIQTFFYKTQALPIACRATKPMEVSSEYELLKKAEERIKTAAINQEIHLTFLPSSQKKCGYTISFGYHENHAKKLPILSHSFILKTKPLGEQNALEPCNIVVKTKKGHTFYRTEGNFQNWLSLKTVDKIESMIHAKLQTMGNLLHAGTAGSSDSCS